MAGKSPTHLLALGALVAALGFVFVFEALFWLLPVFTPASGVGAVAGGAMLIKLASALVLLLAGVFIALFALLRGRRLR